MDWETAFYRQYQDACTGKLLRGILHNLNGANQAFSLQAALLKSMFSQAERFMGEAATVCPRTDCGLPALRDLLAKRAQMVEQMEDKLETSQRIVSRTMPLAHLYGLTEDSEVSLATIVGLEMELLTADAFFKHNIDKQVEIDLDLPPLRHHCGDVHLILFTLLENAATALADSPAPALRLKLRRSGAMLVIEVRDSGPGLALEARARIFEPFFSTHEGALGVGLFLAQKTAHALGGEIGVESQPGDTRFTVSLPLAELT